MRTDRFLAAAVCILLLLSGCGKDEAVHTYKASEEDGILFTYYELGDGTWKLDDTVYAYRLELDGRMPHAESDSCYVVLTNKEDLTFEEVSKSLYSSLLEDSRVMEGSVIVEMR